jgi:ribonuclease D
VTVSLQQPIRLVQQTGALSTLVDAISDAPAIAIDTEFHAERRYQPELMLVQLAIETGSTWVIDPLAVSLDPLASALNDKTVVVHSGSQDLALLQRDCGVAPADAFDIQIAAGMIGLGHPMRLGTLVSELLDLPLDKGATLSDWSRRPLSTAQLSYAAADASVLFPLKAALEERLGATDRLDWAIEESRAMAAQAQTPRPVDHHWTRWEIAPRLDADTHRVITVLFNWRDQQGRNKNQPAHFMLSDGLCLDIARRKPRSLDALAANRRIPQGLMRRLGKEIVGAVEWALENPVDLPTIANASQQLQAKAVILWAETIAQELGVARTLLMSEPLAHQVAVDGTAALKGWRSQAIGASLDRFCAGESGVYWGENGPEIR